ncbi:MAG: PDZ domain-containing protein [Candidatus Zixiibacteriota bacterium]
MHSVLKISLVTIVTLAVLVSIGLSRSSKSGKYPWIGIYGQSVTEDLADAFDLDIEYGAVVNEIVDDSPAEAAGLEEGDIIIAFGGSRVEDYDDLLDMLEERKPDEKVKLKINRDGKEMELEVTLEGRPRDYHSSWRWYDDDDHIVYVPRVPSVPRVPAVPGVPDVPRVLAIPEIDKLVLANSYFDRSYIGVQVTMLTTQLGEFFGVEKGRGMLVTSVEDDSPAAKAGIKAGDVITKADNQRIFERDDLHEVINDFEKGEKINIVIVRDKKEQSVEVEIAERKGSRHGKSYHFSGPDIDIDLPDMDGLHYGVYSDDGEVYFESEDFAEDYREAMEDYREAMEELREELEALRLDQGEEVREAQREAREELRDEIREMQKELRDMSRKLD